MIKKILFFSVLIPGGFIAAYAGILGANYIFPEESNDPVIACWNIKVGRSIGSGTFYFLHLLADKYETLRDDVSSISADLVVSVDERRTLCEIYQELLRQQ